jgi:threonyl-tRNA synthetase
MDKELAVASRIDNLVVRLSNETYAQPVLRDSPEGSRIYKRSILLLLAAAADKNNWTISLGETIGSSNVFRLSSNAISNETALQLMNTMKELIEQNIAINVEHVSRASAINYFNEKNMQRSLEFVSASGDSHIACNSIRLKSEGEPFRSLSHGVLVPSTGYIEAQHFLIEAAETPFPHFRLYYASHNVKTGEFGIIRSDEPRLVQAYATQKVFSYHFHSDFVRFHSCRPGLKV